MHVSLNRFYGSLDRPIPIRSRLVLGLLTLLVAASFAFPLWRIFMRAPQYPQGLSVDIYAYKIEAGHGGEDLQEINDLNHYIGMSPIDRASLSDLDWIPFALGILLLLLLRTALIGNLRTLVDLLTLSLYLGAFSMARFAYRLYVLGHNLNPQAAIKLGPFMPAVLGTKQLGNFTVSSFPMQGTLCLGVFVGVLGGLVAVHMFLVHRGLTDEPEKS
jgi:copper chaperone NosL